MTRTARRAWSIARGRMEMWEVDPDTGERLDGDPMIITDRGTIRALAGPHSYEWWWVKRWGRMGCGCTRNPVTRRRLLTSSDCLEHFRRRARPATDTPV